MWAYVSFSTSDVMVCESNEDGVLHLTSQGVRGKLGTL